MHTPWYKHVALLYPSCSGPTRNKCAPGSGVRSRSSLSPSRSVLVCYKTERPPSRTGKGRVLLASSSTHPNGTRGTAGRAPQLARASSASPSSPRAPWHVCIVRVCVMVSPTVPVPRVPSTPPPRRGGGGTIPIRLPSPDLDGWPWEPGRPPGAGQDQRRRGGRRGGKDGTSIPSSKRSRSRSRTPSRSRSRSRSSPCPPRRRRWRRRRRRRPPLPRRPGRARRHREDGGGGGLRRRRRRRWGAAGAVEVEAEAAPAPAPEEPGPVLDQVPTEAGVGASPASARRP